jgi:methyl-accepting chemotaxis protein
MSGLLDNRTIKQKLLLGIGLILVIFAVSSTIVLIFINSLASSSSNALTVIAPLRTLIHNVKLKVTDADDNGCYLFLDTNKANAAGYLRAYRDDIKQVADAIPLLRDGAATSEERDALSGFETWFKVYQAQNERAFDLRTNGKAAQGSALWVASPTQQGEDLVERYLVSANTRIEAATTQVTASSRIAILGSVLGALTAIAAGLVIALALGSTISKRLNSVTHALQEIVREDFSALAVAMKQLAAGDLTARPASHREALEIRGKDETAMLATSYNDLVTGIVDFGGQFINASEMLTALILEIQSAVELVGSAAREIAAGNINLSQRTEEQAAGLEETAASMEEFTSTVKQNAANARSANDLGVGARQVATTGGTVMTNVVEMMGNIHTSSTKIVEIISVIDGIAFQTNILALNAAVEAARAGEQGRGFAVVASEVRTLAQRSAEAAKEIKSLIGDTVEKVDGGTRLVEEAGKTMQEVVVSVQRVTDIIAEIASASKEQSSGIDQVNNAITQMDSVTQQNAALVEEASAATSSLDEQAQSLVRTVSVFKLDAHAGAAVRPAPKSPVQPAYPAARVRPKAVPALRAPAKKPASHVAVPANAAAKSDSDDQWNSF